MKHIAMAFAIVHDVSVVSNVVPECATLTLSQQQSKLTQGHADLVDKTVGREDGECKEEKTQTLAT